MTDENKMKEVARLIAEHFGDDEDLVRRYQDYAKMDADKALQRLLEHIKANTPIHTSERKAKQVRLHRRWLAAAAALLLMAAGGAVWFHQYTKVVPPEIPREMRTAMLHSQLTGRQGAIIESLEAPLSPPDRAPLSPPEGGTIDSALKTIEAPSGAVGGASEASCVTTLSDKEYWVTMSDGTLVHLNYNTRVIYPEKFVGDSRDVYLDGEAYFMVAKDKRHPFIVHTPQGDIRVHGTEFNVSTRGGESGKWKEESGKWKEERGKWKEAYCTEVVLVKGSVGVTPTSGSEQMMRPGQKCSILNSQFSIDEVDVEPYVAWNTGTFVFEDCPLSQLMDVLSKWYGFKVVFQSTEAWEKHFTGEIDRYGSIRPTLEAISQVTGLSLYVRDGKIVIE